MCDCGNVDTCNEIDHCCTPKSGVSPGCVLKRNKLRGPAYQYQCSPQEGPCCEAASCSFTAKSVKCQDEEACKHSSYCNGQFLLYFRPKLYQWLLVFLLTQGPQFLFKVRYLIALLKLMGNFLSNCWTKLDCGDHFLFTSEISIPAMAMIARTFANNFFAIFTRRLGEQFPPRFIRSVSSCPSQESYEM